MAGKGGCLAGAVQKMPEEMPAELVSEDEGCHGPWELQGQKPRGRTKLGGEGGGGYRDRQEAACWVGKHRLSGRG